MRMTPFQVKLVCQKILLNLRSKQLVSLQRSETEITAKMEEVFLRELRVEDEINREAEKLLEQYAATMGDKIDKERMFDLIKRQLIKDKKVII